MSEEEVEPERLLLLPPLLMAIEAAITWKSMRKPSLFSVQVGLMKLPTSPNASAAVSPASCPYFFCTHSVPTDPALSSNVLPAVSTASTTLATASTLATAKSVAEDGLLVIATTVST